MWTQPVRDQDSTETELLQLDLSNLYLVVIPTFITFSENRQFETLPVLFLAFQISEVNLFL